MSTEKIDKTKQNIGLSQLDDKEKKQLFNKFVEAGGKVIKDKGRKGLTDFDRSRQQGYRKKFEGQPRDSQGRVSPAGTKKEFRAGSDKKEYRSAAAVNRSRNPLVKLIERLHIRVRLFFMGVADFSGGYFTKGFLEKLNLDLKTALQEIQLSYIDIFRQNPRVGAEITAELDKINPVYYELMEMSGSIFDRTVMSQIAEHFNKFPHITQKTDEIREPLMGIFKKLYVLYPHQDNILFAFERAISHQMRLEKGKSSIYSYKKRKIKNNLYVTYRRFFKCLYWLFCHYQREILPIPGQDIDRILVITPNDLPGRRERLSVAAERNEQETEISAEESEKTEPEEIPEEVARGLEMMYRLDSERMKAKYDRDDAFRLLKDSDKILMAHMIFKEFDEEYSFVLTTNKIKYNVQFTPEGKIDYRLKLTDLYNDLRGCMNIFKDYADVLAAYEKIRNEKPMSSSQYMEYSNRLTSIDKKRNSTGKNVRMTVRAFMERVAGLLKVLVEDMGKAQQIVQNPQDLLSFESGIEGSKKMEGRKVYEAIESAYYYSSAYVYRLSPAGDLHGELEFNQEDLKKLQDLQTQEIEKEKTSEQVKKTEKPAKEKSETGESVIDELDDLF